ncbi:hypothetical protein CDAR_256531 [Caerostris darwini]|uniref:Uncharacterized protein n=1 Tax=Caerostris darwini TaxID=1538125 RepID=A0AAV4PHN7_9ARAC|nr:hypothetical protein CDAR_256531 [Caerostris darwini]
MNFCINPTESKGHRVECIKTPPEADFPNLKARNVGINRALLDFIAKLLASSSVLKVGAATWGSILKYSQKCRQLYVNYWMIFDQQIKKCIGWAVLGTNET